MLYSKGFVILQILKYDSLLHSQTLCVVALKRDNDQDSEAAQRF